MDLILFVIGVLSLIASLVLLVASIFKKKTKKYSFIGIVVSLLLMVTGLSMPSPGDNSAYNDIERDKDKGANIPITEVDKDKPSYTPTHNKPKNDNDDPVENEIVEKEVPDRKKEIEKVVKSRIDEGDYTSTKLDKITINNNLGDEEEETYITLVYMEFDIKNRRNTANEMMRMYSDDLAATLAKKGIDDVAEIAVFWEDEYNERDLKYAYEYKDGGFFIMDIAGE